MRSDEELTQLGPSEGEKHGKGAVPVIERMLDVLRDLRPILERLKKRNRDLENQITRAATSVLLNLGEADGNAAGNRRLRLQTALGSARELRVGLRGAVALGYLEQDVVWRIDAKLDRVIAMTYGWARVS